MAIQPVEQGSAFAFRNVINNNFYELKVLSGASKPTQSTAAVVGQMYLDTSEGKMYFCSNVSGSVYTWKPFASDMSASNVSYNNDSSGMSSDNVQDAIDELFTSASNGKELIADAITGMGVSTSANDTYATMAGNIGKIETGIDISDATLTAASELKKDIIAYSKTGKRIVGSLGQGVVNTPSISVNSEGKITASTSYTSGIIGSSTVSNTRQLTTQIGRSFIPSTSDQTIYQNRYLIGDITFVGLDLSKVTFLNKETGNNHRRELEVNFTNVQGLDFVSDTSDVGFFMIYFFDGDDTSADPLLFVFDNGVAKLYYLYTYEGVYGGVSSTLSWSCTWSTSVRRFSFTLTDPEWINNGSGTSSRGAIRHAIWVPKAIRK